MSSFSRPDQPMSEMDPIKAMNENLSRLAPQGMAGAFNLFAHPLGGVAAMSALGFGLASQAVGVWVGAVTGAVEASQRLWQPILDGDLEEPRAKRDTAISAVKARAATKALIEKAQSLSREAGDAVAAAERQPIDNAPGVAVADAVATEVAPADDTAASLMPEDFRQPKAAERPENPDDLKAISGVGPKLEKTLNGLGIWSYAQIAALAREEVAWLDDYLGFKGRIGRDDWLAQAAALAGEKRPG